MFLQPIRMIHESKIIFSPLIWCRGMQDKEKMTNHISWFYYEIPLFQTNIPIASNNWLTFNSPVANTVTLQQFSDVFIENLKRRPPSCNFWFHCRNPQQVKPSLPAETHETQKTSWAQSPCFVFVSMSVYMLLYVEEKGRWQPATVNSLTRQPLLLQLPEQHWGQLWDGSQ